MAQLAVKNKFTAVTAYDVQNDPNSGDSWVRQPAPDGAARRSEQLHGRDGRMGIGWVNVQCCDCRPTDIGPIFADISYGDPLTLSSSCK
mmetsp:Transcript_15527/g.41981  ORF Transcript_15527/g.41981 Transcript_15527/m.41981 type:complete len:89 (-) Transcript_15527:1169-1435(-)|eukprot:2034406-Prymnesium_polylepis.3